MKYIAERGLASIREAVHAAYSAKPVQNMVEVRVVPMLALLDDLDLTIKQRDDLLAALEAITHAYIREVQRGTVEGYDPEGELVVKQARAAVAGVEGNKRDDS